MNSLDSQTFYRFSNSIEDTLKLVIKCSIETDHTSPIMIKFKIDTGATYTVVNARDLGITETEKEFVSRLGLKREIHVGIDKAAKIIYYPYVVKKLNIGKFELTNFPVRISFNNDAWAKLIGMNLLRLFKIEMNPEEDTFTLTETKQLAEYTHTGKSMHNIDNELADEYISLDNMQIIEANYINQLIKNEK